MKAFPPTLVFRIADLEIAPGRLAEYKALLAEHAEAAVRLEPGVLFLYAVNIRGEPAKIRVVEGYGSQADYLTHLQAPHFLKYKTLTADMVLSLHLQDMDPITLAGK